MITSAGGWFFIETAKTSYILRIDETGHAEHIYYGSRIGRDPEEAECINGPRDVKIGDGTYQDEDNQFYFPSNIMSEYAAPGRGDTREAAIIAEYGNGLITLDPVYSSHSIYKGKKCTEAPVALSGEETETLELVLTDTAEDIAIRLFYTVYPEEDVILRSASIENGMDRPLTLRTVSSLQLDLPDAEWDLLTFDGAWARERNETRRRLSAGTASFGSTLGFTSSEHSSLFFLARPDADDRHGTAIGFGLIYSGNHLERIETSPFGKCRVLSSINPYGFSWELRKGESFSTPEAVMAFSSSGIDEASWSFHRFIKRYVSRGSWCGRERPVLLNSWEATYFDITEEKLLRFASKAAEAGMELFVLDDGWYGRRTDDTRGLGDWKVNTERIPHGLRWLSDRIHGMGLMFGIWVEPEMVSIDSELYERHPEWIIAIPGRKPAPGRHQYILDMSRSDVREYLMQSLSDVFSSGIDYVKWDCNRNMSDYFSSNPELRSCGELMHRYILGLYDLMAGLRERFPGILFEFCASGGNRYDMGMLSFMDQGWTSDNTDLLHRIAIQHGTLRGFPPYAMCNHVSASPNHQCLRISGLDDRFGLAAFGNLGYELDILALDEDGIETIRQQTEFYKAHRKTFQYGRFRHLPPDGGNLFWSIEGSDEIIVLEIQSRCDVNTGRHHRLVVPFAESGREYRIERREKHISPDALGDSCGKYEAMEKKPFRITVSGDILRSAGIALPVTFMGRGFYSGVRVMCDNSTDIFVITKLGRD